MAMYSAVPLVVNKQQSHFLTNKILFSRNCAKLCATDTFSRFCGRLFTLKYTWTKKLKKET